MHYPPEGPLSIPLSTLIGAVGCTLLHGAATAAAAPARAREPAPTEDTQARAVPDAAWRAVIERDVSLRMRGGLEPSGRLIAEDADTVTLIQTGGAVAVLQKDDIEALRVLEKSDAPAGAEPPPDASDAAPEGFRKSGGYVLLSPGGLSQQFYLSNSDGYDYYNYNESGDTESHTFFQWGLGVGGYLATKGAFAFSGGLSLQHATGKLIEDVHANLFRVGPEFRLGASGKRIFGYGLIDFHGLVQRVSVKDEGVTASVSASGVGGTFGGGAQGLVGKRFILGGELKVPVDYLFEKEDSDGFTIGGLTMVAVDVRFLLGVKF